MITFRKFLEQKILGLIEDIHIDGIGKIPCKVDSGNGAYNVLHGINIKDTGNNKVSFDTISGTVEKELLDTVTIHVGAGEEEHRPVVSFDVKMGDETFKDVLFSIGNRTDNEYACLLGKDFIAGMHGLIDVSKEYALRQ